MNTPECTAMQLEAQSSPKGVPSAEGQKHSPLADPGQAEMLFSFRDLFFLQRSFPPPEMFSSSSLL